MDKEKTIVRYGAKGANVTDLQRTLNQNGYNLQEDGVFGQKTLAAVKDYQKKNALTVDGVVGNQTWTALSGGAKASPTSSGNVATPASKTTGGKNTDAEGNFSYGDYVESDTVVQAQAALNAAQAAKPGAYSSQWQAQIDDILARISGREDFSYDVNGDALYQQYKDQYMQGGKMAMQDTMGQAAAMTGGYGNSYAASVGNQAYQGYLQQLNDKVPELAQMAYDRYQQEGQDMLDLYALYSDQEDADYGRYRDSVSDYLTERDYAAGRYDSERSYDYSKYADERDFAYGDYRNDVADEQWQTQYDESVRQYNEQFEYGKERDAVADRQWQQQYDESQRQFNESIAEDRRQFNKTYAFNKQQYDDSKASGNNSAALEHVSSISSADLVTTLKDYRADEDNEGLASFLDDCVATGRLTEEQADNYYAKYRISSTKTTDTTVPKNKNYSGGGGGTINRQAVK